MAQNRFADELPGFTGPQVERARGLVEWIAEARSEIASLEGEILGAMNDLASIADEAAQGCVTSDGPEYARRAMTAEVAAATRVHPNTARAQMDDAERIVDRLPETFDALAEGRLSLPHARIVADASRHLDSDACASLDSCAVPFAETSTPGELRRITKKQAADLAAESPRERHEIARADRRISLTELDDGMSELHVVLPTFEARTIHDRLTRMAKHVKIDHRRARSAFIREYGCTPEEFSSTLRSASRCADVAATDLRTIDQLRVDILADIALSAAPTGHQLHASGSELALENVRAEVQITIPFDLLLDADGGPSWIDEGALISSDTARTAAAMAPGWNRLFVKPESGTVVSVDRYRPSTEQKRALRARDMTCRFPGCTTAARRSDIDHTHDYARGGPTAVENLSALCESHHRVKHVSGWTPVQVAGGLIEWLSPLGYTYRDEPTSRVFFRETIGLNGARHERESGEEGRRRMMRDIRRATLRDLELRDQAYATEDDQRADRLAAMTQAPPVVMLDILRGANPEPQNPQSVDP